MPLALLACLQWSAFVVDPPVGRALLVVAVASAGGAALAATGTAALAGTAGARRASRAAVQSLRLLIAAVTCTTALVVMGLPLRLLAPGHWDELGANVDTGLAGIAEIEWPYDGAEPWVRLVILLAAPLAAGAAAALAFWPLRRAGGFAAGLSRGAALVLLLALFATAVTERDPGDDLVHGLLLLGALAGWIWLPRLRGREALVGACAVAAAGLLALPAAGRMARADAWVDYQAWQWFGPSRGAVFDWTHSYGPIDWPRSGKPLLTVRSEKPHYWRAQTLDRFDGFRWTHSPANRNTAPRSEVPEPLNERWLAEATFTVRDFQSELVVGVGTPLAVRGIGSVSTTADGTTEALGEPLREGDGYEVLGYSPEPDAARMRAAPDTYTDNLRLYTGIELPRRGESAIEGSGRAGDAARSMRPPAPRVAVAMRATPGSGTPFARRQLLDSPYARTYRLARRLGAGGGTAYDVVRRVERHLARGFTYNERPPSAAVPIHAFLFEERSGYCQQFSGAMALLLRMNGIPARVAAGFSPGRRDRDTGEFRVRDLDAHSWVEVWFSGIGWVAFDPTPAAAPARSQAAGEGSDSAAVGDEADAGGGGDDGGGGGEGAGLSERSTDSGAAAPDGRGGLAGLALGAALAALSLAGAALVRDALLRRRLRGLGHEGELEELRCALRHFGIDAGAPTTLLALERRLAGAAAGDAARFLRGLRERRFARGSRDPAPRGRRALRRALAGGAAPSVRARAALRWVTGA